MNSFPCQMELFLSHTSPNRRKSGPQPLFAPHFGPNLDNPNPQLFSAPHRGPPVVLSPTSLVGCPIGVH
ncbi:hypothetical protein HanXRQr2_Chr10g0465701 [Helianthus annuus]|uniref:Uncharacterized protein n=1 Tax=Helianthus annuus TaxID=4232 RepID=A0A9K3I1K7_HELAN|nr:hypothetical protein HanXRQr2_Chr10g0465701 [Helianthus annuus]